MLVVPVYEPIPCQTPVTVNCVPVMLPDCCFVDDTSCSTLSWEVALIFPTGHTVAAIPLDCLLVLVVFIAAGLQVFGTFIKL